MGPLLFNIVDVNRKTLVLQSNGQPEIWVGEEAAKERVEHLRLAAGRAFKMKRAVKDDDNLWRIREAQRMHATYVRLPWEGKSWYVPVPDHFAHVSIRDPGKIAYTPDASFGRDDRQLRVRPGKYLNDFYGDVLRSADIKELATKFASEFGKCQELLFAKTADEIEEVYRKGPSSCMAGDEYRRSQGWGDWRSPFHPVRVYAHSLEVAYLKDGDDIISRALVYPKEKTYSRLYGDDYQLQKLLQEAGYNYGAPIGATLERVMIDDHYFVAPYIDAGMSSGCGCLRVVDRKTHLEIVSQHADGIVCGELYGRVDKRLFKGADEPLCCQSCGDAIDDSTEVWIRRSATEFWCPDCVNEHSVLCTPENRHVSNQSVIEMVNGEFWSAWIFSDRGACCAFSHANVEKSKAIKFYSKNGFVQYCLPEFLEEKLGICSLTNVLWRKQDLVTHSLYGSIGMDAARILQDIYPL